MRPHLPAALLLLASAAPLSAQPLPPIALPTGQMLTPTAVPGSRFEPLTVRDGPRPDYVADGAAALALSPDGRELLVLTSGYNKVNGADGKEIDAASTQFVLRYALGPDGARWVQTLPVPNSFGGIAWRPDGTGFAVGGGVDDKLLLFARRGDRFDPAGDVALGHKAGNGADVQPQAAGVAFSPDGRRALVANYYNDSVSLVDFAARRVVAELDLRPGKIDRAKRGVPGGSSPFAVAWAAAGTAFVSAPRDREIVRLAISGDRLRVAGRTHTLAEPTALLADPARGRLVATEDNGDRLALLDLATGRLRSEPRLALPASLGAPLAKGLNPNGLALGNDGRLLVTLGGINALAIVGRSGSIDALLPTGWYPSAVARAGSRLFVANRKSPPGPNPQGCAPRLAIARAQPNACGAANQYIWQLEKAGLLTLPEPTPAILAAATRQVAANLGLADRATRRRAEAAIARLRPLIRHVVFIIKENRTYDQLLGDLPGADGDPRLAILGGALSPNHHRLASQFVTLDRFFDSGEVSSSGWTWSTAGRETDLLEKTVPVNYAGRGLAYEAEGTDRNIAASQSLAGRVATNPKTPDDPDILPGPALLTAPDADDDRRPNEGFLWDAAIRAGLSVRNYGFADASVYDSGAPGDVPPIRDPFAEKRTVWTPADRQLATRSDPYFRGFDQRLADFWRVKEWQREFDAADAAGTVPALTLLRLSHDHFGSFDKAIDGVDTVEAQMADNDYSLGLVIERLSRSRDAASTVVFVIEDDAQNGADHVDARRSIALVVGAHVRRGAVISTRYTTVSVVRTIGALLGLKPLGLNDALAMPMADLFDPDPALAHWRFDAVAAAALRSTALPIPASRFAPATTASACPRRDSAWWASAMAGQDFSSEDRLDTARFNAALWDGLGDPAAAAAPCARSVANR
ncbi:hypothetical protein ABDK56_04200 [Sphingomonas sp. ASV193]|uniref:bifunctional YncE family protein/alkaline phosphatase family protein n=1 Tax=Sphingomonas sp. ASV193 TaxID=3144405 RepID=UPI0032E8A2F1